MMDEVAYQLEKIREAILAHEEASENELSRVHHVHRERARNLVRYRAFRERLQPGLGERLKMLGLDPLDGIEYDVMNRLATVIQRLNEMSGSGKGSVDAWVSRQNPDGRELLRVRSESLFGFQPDDRETRIMVTLPADGDDGGDLVHRMIVAGADCFRINCGRDNRESWHRLIDQIRREEAPGRRPLIFMDLGGPKLRVTSCAGGRRSIRLEVGDTLFVNKGNFPSVDEEGKKADGDEESRREIAVSDPTALAGVLPGHRVWFDDGKIGGVVRERGGDALRVEITYAQKGGRKLRLERGLNLPDTPVRLPALTQKDLDDLPFAARHADFVALSFIRASADVEEFRSALEAVSGASPAMVIKIETREALRNLPELMLAAMCHEKAALLLARGDLAVECGILEIPRIQREVLCYCAAGALPLFWATGVLERMCRTGEPLRAEVTDAVEAAGAQCIMLNKGPYTDDAVRLLGDLLKRSTEKR